MWKATFPPKPQVRPARLSLVALSEQTRFKMSAPALDISLPSATPIFLGSEYKKGSRRLRKGIISTESKREEEKRAASGKLPEVVLVAISSWSWLHIS